ncbi:MAG: ATP synthase F0 subunit B [Deltaproteobacteria bacterium]|nr:ATP synthase F0 subunit B [Deltaproteobacteria bacterium]
MKAKLKVSLMPASLFIAQNCLAGTHGPATISSLFWPVLNAVIYVFVIIYLYRRYGRIAIKEHALKVTRHIESAARQLSEASSAFTRTKGRLDNIEVEREQVIKEYEDEGWRLAEEIKQQAVQNAQALKNAVKRQSAKELIQAQNELRQEVVAKALDLARKRFATELNNDDDRRLREQAINSL